LPPFDQFRFSVGAYFAACTHKTEAAKGDRICGVFIEGLQLQAVFAELAGEFGNVASSLLRNAAGQFRHTGFGHASDDMLIAT